MIVHHYNAPHSLAFPILHSGIILSAPALKRYTHTHTPHTHTHHTAHTHNTRMATLSGSFNPSFNIDPVFEVAPHTRTHTETNYTPSLVVLLVPQVSSHPRLRGATPHHLPPSPRWSAPDPSSSTLYHTTHTRLCHWLHSTTELCEHAVTHIEYCPFAKYQLLIAHTV